MIVKGVSKFGAVTIGVSIATCLTFYSTYIPNAYEIYLNGRAVACVKNTSTADSIKNKVFADIKSRFKDIKIEDNLIYTSTIASSAAMSSESDIRDNILKSLNVKVKAVEMTVDGRRAAVLANSKEGETVINKVVNYFTSKVDMSKYTLTGVINNIKYNPVEVAIGEVNDVEKVTQKLIENSDKGAAPSIKIGISAIKPQNKVVAKGSAVSSMALPSRGTVSSNFGMRWGRMHEGIDIAAKYGEPIYAAMDGKVIYAGWIDGYGNAVKIQHSNGIETLYGHSSRLRVQTGATVKKGQLIADVGSTGNSTGPHLHFEVRINGVAVNPYKYIYTK